MTPRPAFTQEASEFVQLARATGIGRGVLGDTLNAAKAAKATDRVEQILKAAVVAGTTDSPNWASSLYGYQSLATAFADSLRGQGAFDTLRVAMRNVLLKTRIVVAASSIVGEGVAQGAPKPVSSISLAATAVDARKATGQIVISEELLRAPSQALFAAELRGALIAATDSVFVPGLVDGSTPATAATGVDAISFLADLASAAALMTLHSRSALYLIVDPATAARLALLSTTGGDRAFGDLSIGGGDIAGITVVASEAIGVDSNGVADLLLVDGFQVAAADQTITLSASREASIEMDTAPTNPPTASTVLVSLWQQGLASLMVHRWFGFARLRDNAAVQITGASYGVAA